jgi:4-amino-4-deoxy-L-arabinose transferase-like glycosyltransferase
MRNATRSATADRPRGTTLFLRQALLGLALAFVGIYLAIAPARIAYPFELEWMEGACVDHVRRILAGQQLYVSPSLDFVPFVYPPLYFYLSAAVTKLTGVGFLPLRLVSFGSSLGCFALIFFMVRRQARCSFAGIVAVGLFAACYRIAGAWYDIARVDMLCLLFLLAAIYLVQLDRSWPYQLLAGVLVALAFVTKQTALAVALPVMLFAVAYQRGRGLVFAAAGLLLSGGATLVLDRPHGGWYSYYVFDLPRQHEIDTAAALGFWTTDMLAAVPLALAGVLFFLAHEARHDRRGFFLWGAVVVGAIGAAWSGRAHSGGYNNVVIPAYAALSIIFALALDTATTTAQGRGKVVLAAVYLLCIGQFLRLGYNPRQQLPTAADRRAGEKIISAMRAIPGDVYMPYHGYLPTLAGKRSYAHAMAVWDVARGRDEQAKERLIGEIVGAIRQRRFAAVIVDSDVFAQPDLDSCYTRSPIQFAGNVFYPVTGMATRPKWLCLPDRRPR